MEPAASSLGIRIIIADDHALLREGIKSFLRKCSDIQVVDEASDGQELLEKVALSKPDIVITDLTMPKINGVEACRRLTKDYPTVNVIMQTMHTESSWIKDSIEAGAKGYLLKHAHPKEFIESIMTVHSGSTYYCSETQKLLDGLYLSIFRKSGTEQASKALNVKEIAVLRSICQENQNKEIAEKLNMSIRTVENYRENLFEKTGAKTVAGLVLYAIANKIYTP